jgi:hypothetical protein
MPVVYGENNGNEPCQVRQSLLSLTGNWLTAAGKARTKKKGKNNMMQKTIDEILVDFEGEMDEAELSAYVQRGRQKYGKALRGIKCIQDGEYVEITYDVKPQRFHRLRRITGYLVGDMNRWNNGKRAEEKDRVKHDV